MSCIDTAFWTFRSQVPGRGITRKALRFFIVCHLPVCLMSQYYACDKISQAFPGSSFCILQVTKNWRQERPGNKAKLWTSPYNICNHLHILKPNYLQLSHHLHLHTPSHRVPFSTRAVTFGRWFGSRRQLVSSCSTSVLKGEWWVYLVLHPVRKPERRIDLNTEFLLHSKSDRISVTGTKVAK